MKTPQRAQSATSLPQAPRDDAESRFVTYAITMGIRMACLILTVVVTPYGWYTWVFAVGAVFLPYFAVVIANVSQDTRREAAESPERRVEAAPPMPGPAPDAPPVIRISEAGRIEALPSERPDAPS